MKKYTQSADELLAEIKHLREQLATANDTLDAIRNGQIDALVVKGHSGHAVYTLKSADLSYRIFIETMTEGAVTLSQAGIVLYCNSKLAAMVGKPLSKVLGCRFSGLIAARSQKDFSEVFEKAWAEQDVKLEICLQSPAGDLPVLLSLNTLELEEGTSLSVLLTDLSQQKKTEAELNSKNEELKHLNEELAKSNNDLLQFASVASHDLQEPLRKIEVFANILEEAGVKNLSPETREPLAKIIISAARMRLLILDILNYSRLSSGSAEFEATSLESIFHEILDDFEITIREKKATIHLGKLPVAEVNKVQMRQVFQNMISNALKFTRPGVDPVIAISEKPIDAKELGLSVNEPDFCRISIQDNGIGFDEKYVTVIFNLFEKLNPKSRYEGSGIGLALAKKIVDKHHGVIVAKSKLGEGSEFNIILPLKRRLL